MEVKIAIAILLAHVACDKPATHGDAGGSPPAASSPAVQASAQPSASAGAKLCLPVAACNMFIRCALVQEEPDPGDAGASRYRVLAYEHHPHQVGSHFGRGEVCWPQQGDVAPGCADALLYTNVPCTPTPPKQGPLQYRCAMKGEACVDLQ